MIKLKYYEYAVITMYIIAIALFLHELVQSGLSNIKLYQVVMLVLLLVSFADGIRTFLRNKN